eukprot:COSAG04_NODE_212_length_20108_cov_107.515418_9_plen_444_part_00
MEVELTSNPFNTRNFDLASGTNNQGQVTNAPYKNRAKPPTIALCLALATMIFIAAAQRNSTNVATQPRPDPEPEPEPPKLELEPEPPRPPPRQPPRDAAKPRGPAHSKCPTGCVFQTEVRVGAFFGDHYNRCSCVAAHALSARQPPPANFSLTGRIEVTAAMSAVFLEGHINVDKTTVTGVPSVFSLPDRQTKLGKTGKDGTSGGGGAGLAVGGCCHFEYSLVGSVLTQGSFALNGTGLLVLHNGSAVSRNCNTKGSTPPDCKCATRTLTLSDVEWYTANVPWNAESLRFLYTQCTQGQPRRCEDYFAANTQEFNRDNSGGVAPDVRYVYRHADGTRGAPPHLLRIEGTVAAEVTIIFTVTIVRQTIQPVPLDSPTYTRPPCILASPRGDCACVFPFTYKDRTYAQCTQVDETAPWCALETRRDGTFDPHRNDWAFCTGPASC